MSTLININGLERQSGLWVLDEPTQFNYLDYEASELFLKRVVSEAIDISSHSLELENCHPSWDWVAEYHLSSKRANILRGFDLTGIKKVLEIGCGCGAVTRYLGEQGIHVDAVEVAQRQADIARLRCRDLDNINIINANPNDLRLPESTYDAILIMGMVDIIGKHFSGTQSVGENVISTLKRLQLAQSPNSIIVIAVENRTGLKYWLGAPEDHYGKPYVGISDYWGTTGKKTFTINEWEALLHKSGIDQWHFQFPFPDHKLSQLILDEHFIDTDQHAYSLLYRTESRSYHGAWQPSVNEFTLWRSLHLSNQLKEHANSLLILAGKEINRLKLFAPNDFVYFSGGSRKPEYRTMTVKTRHANQVKKIHFWNKSGTTLQTKVEPNSITDSYVQGPLLSTLWLEAFLCADQKQLQTLLIRYHNFITDQLRGQNANKLLDALPANIVVDSNDHYQIIDQEWVSEEPMTIEYIFFRALLWFGHDNQKILMPFFQSNKIASLIDFIEYGFGVVSDLTSFPFMTLVSREERLQFEVSGQKNIKPIHQLVMTPFVSSISENECLKLYWAAEDQDFIDSRSIECSYTFENGQAYIRGKFFFELSVTRIRIIPLLYASKPKLLMFRKILLSEKLCEGSNPSVILQIDSASELISKIKHNHAVYPVIKSEGAFIVANKFGAIDLTIDSVSNAELGLNRLFELKIFVSGETDLNPSFISDYMTKNISSVEQKCNKYEKISAKQHDSIVEKNHLLTLKKDENRRLRIKLNEAIEKADRLNAKLSSVYADFDQIRQFLNRLAQVKFIKSVSRMMSGKYGWINLETAKYDRRRMDPETYNLVQQSGLFDKEFYLEYQPDLNMANDDPIIHYLMIGGYNGLNPNRLFDTKHYENQFTEAIAPQNNPLIHYLTVGVNEGKNPCYLFDSQYYLGQLPDDLRNGINPLKHYLENGSQKGLDPHPAFDTHYYYAQNPDAKKSSLTPLEHFFLFGEPAKQSPTPLFDWDYYLDNRPDVKAAGVSAFRHFIEEGYKETGGDPSRLFKSDFYFKGDLLDLKYQVNPICHYISKGQQQSRSPNPYFDPNYYLDQLDSKDRQNLRDPFSHYILTGEENNLNPHPLLDIGFYRNQLAKIGLYPDNLLEFFYEKGLEKDCLPHPLFDPGFCLAQLSHDCNRFGVGLSEYYSKESFGVVQVTHPLFTAEYYRTHLDANHPGRDNPLIHYGKVGCDNGLSTHPLFDPNYYISQPIEPAIKAGQSPIVHYIYHGAQNELWPNRELNGLPYKPKLDIVLLVNGPNFRYLASRILTVMSQLYPRWEMTVIVRNPDNSENYRYAHEVANDDKRINWVEANDADSTATLLNRALEKTTNEYIVFLNEQMYLHAHALLFFIRQLNIHSKLTLIHADRDQNDPDSIPVEQPGSDPHGSSVRFFVGPLACFKRSAIEKIGGFASWHQSAYDVRFLTHLLHRAPQMSVAHISESLHFTMGKDPLHIAVRPK